jgi:hypothetical protein
MYKIYKNGNVYSMHTNQFLKPVDRKDVCAIIIVIPVNKKRKSFNLH